MKEKKIKNRSNTEKELLIKRINKIEGQARGIKKMIENDRYCGDILIQISAIDKSLKSLGNIMLKSHLKSCVVEEIKKDNLEILDEVSNLIKQLC